MKIMIFQNVMVHSMVSRYPYVGGACSRYHQAPFTLKMEAVGFSEILVSSLQKMQCHISEDGNVCSH